MKEKILGLIKKFGKEIIIGVLTFFLVSSITGNIATYFKKPDIVVNKKERPKYDYSFDDGITKCIYNSPECDPDNRFLKCVENPK